MRLFQPALYVLVTDTCIISLSDPTRVIGYRLMVVRKTNALLMLFIDCGRRLRLEAVEGKEMTMSLDWILFGVTVYAVLMFELMVADAMAVVYDRVHRK